MNKHTDGWFTEICSGRGSGVALSMKVKQVLHEETTKYQKIMVFESETFGKCLSLDGAIQCTELDEFSYQEMIAFLALNSHPNPAKVLIIGGGDGGVARECLKHPLVKELVQCEIDERVVELAKLHFPQMAQSYANPKMKLVIQDGFEFLNDFDKSQEKEAASERFDVIITDSSDPEGPAECLFKREYYELIERRLKPNGVMCCQAESFWFDLKFIVTLMEMNRHIFKQVAYASCLTCTYPSGQIGFLVCAKSAPEAPKITSQQATHDYKTCEQQQQIGHLRGKPQLSDWLLVELNKLNLKYYSLEAHQAAFVLPQFVEQQLYSKPPSGSDKNLINMHAHHADLDKNNNNK